MRGSVLGARIAMAWGVFVPVPTLAVPHHGGRVAALARVVVYVPTLAGVFAWRFGRGATRETSLMRDEFELEEP